MRLRRDAAAKVSAQIEAARRTGAAVMPQPLIDALRVVPAFFQVTILWHSISINHPHIAPMIAG